MSYTTHGYQIPGTPVTEPKPKTVARCGGMGLCEQCSRESWQAQANQTVSIDWTPAKVTQIPPAPISEEDLRLACLGLAVEWTAAFENVETNHIFGLADEFKKYVRPTSG